MSDIFDRDKRRAIMSAVKSQNSVAEKIVFKYLQSRHIYFQKHYSKIIGKPDITIPSKKKAIFIDGDYWHGRFPEKVTNTFFWKNKISNNVARDKLVNKTLAGDGWQVLRVWGSDITRKNTQTKVMSQIEEFLISR